MDIKQPTSSRTREAMEQFIRQKDENGFYKYSLFHALDGSDFLLDYQLFSEGTRSYGPLLVPMRAAFSVLRCSNSLLAKGFPQTSQ